MALIKVNSRQLFIFRQDQAMTPEKEEFVKRLEEVVNLLGYPKHGRQTQLALYYKLKQPSVKKWFHGESMPAYEVAANLCKRAYVSYEWLMTGRGEKHFIEDVAQLDPQTKAATLLMENMDAQEKYQAVQVLTALAQSKNTKTQGQ